MSEQDPRGSVTRRPVSPGAEEVLGLYFPVLDHGFVALVDYMGTDACIERAARVSYGHGTRKTSLTRGLLRYLRRHKHTTPSEMVELKFHCAMPMFVARQWIRHRTACLAGDAVLSFDLPGAKKRGGRQHHGVTLEKLFRLWTEGTHREHEAHVPMRVRLAAMRLRSCNEENGEIEHTGIVDLWQSGVKPVYEVVLENGRSLRMSKDHRCLTERGWLTLEQATGLRLVGDHVIWRGDAPRFAVNGVPAHRDPGWLAARREEGLDLAQIAARARVSTHAIRKALRRHGLQYSASERARLSGLAQRGQRRSLRSRCMTEQHLAAIRKARSGVASNFWKGGTSSMREGIGRWTTQAAPRVHARCSYRCVICSGRRRLHAHHVDPVWHNPARARDISNLVSLCSDCHDALHAANLELELLAASDRGDDLTRFWQGRSSAPRPFEKRASRTTRLVRGWSRISRIEYAGEQMTYDVEVAGPFHNFVANGFIVHNSVNEYSGRYSLMPMAFYTPSAEQLQTQSPTNNQGRSGEAVEAGRYAEAVARWNAIRDAAEEAYTWMTSHEIARELARIDLPLSTYTQWYWKIDLHNLLHFLTLRVDPHAQWEIQEYGRVMAGMLERVAPLSFEAWIDYDVCGARLSRMEIEALGQLLRSESDAIASVAGRLDRKALEAKGLSKREVEELLRKLAAPVVPRFTLDVASARPPEYFAERMEGFVPKVDAPPPEG